MKEINPSNLQIRIDFHRGRLYFPVRDSADAELHYMIHNDGDITVIEFTHTYVPEDLRNRGIGTQLVERGVQLAKSNQYKVDPSCPFVSAYLEKHPEFDGMRMSFV